MKRNIHLLTILTALIFQSCGLKTAKEVGLHFSTEKSKLPDSLCKLPQKEYVLKVEKILTLKRKNDEEIKI